MKTDTKISKYRVQSVDKKPPVDYDNIMEYGRCFILEYVNIGKGDGKIILTDGKDRASFDFIDMYVVEGKEYAVLLEDGDDMVTIMGFSEGDGKNPEKFYTVDDDKIFDRVLSLYENDDE